MIETGLETRVTRVRKRDGESSVIRYQGLQVLALAIPLGPLAQLLQFTAAWLGRRVHIDGIKHEKLARIGAPGLFRRVAGSVLEP